jgi:3-dehydroshikimate dehydratase
MLTRLVSWGLRRWTMLGIPADISRHRSIATVCLSGTLDDRLAAAAAAGFGGVEIFENHLIASASPIASIRSHVSDLGG